MRHRGWVFLIVLLSLLLLSACGGGSASTSVATGGQVSAPSLEELQDALKAEFDRLGIDPEKVTAKAPQKAENTTFDFAVELDDPDGPGGDPHDGIALSWTERLVGDYNQDGMVTGNDLTPLGQNYSMSTSIPKAKYDDPALHGGITYWPTGDPRGSGALNWRMARVDGNHDGHILLYDITPIAVHWEERLTGYRVWRKPPGGSFELMPDPDDAGSEMTIPRPDASEITNDAPVVYDFLDAQAVAGELGDGVYSYYIEPYDETTSTAGPASAIITIDTATGIVNQSPVAALSVSPNFAGAPAVITLDATASFDPDGTVEGYVWDFDGDGTPDWTTSEAVPEQSSDGTVTDITPMSDGVVEATYTQGSADWKFPAVAAIDDEGARGLVTVAKLGISGWDYIPLINSTTEYVSLVLPEVISTDPVDDKHIYASSGYNSEVAGYSQRGLYLVKETASGPWDVETIPAPFLDGVDDVTMYVYDIVWDENNKPILLVEFITGGVGRSWIAHKQTDESWNVFEVETPEYPATPSRVGISPVIETEPGRFACRVRERLGDKQHINGVIDFHVRLDILFYDHGEWSIEYSGLDSAETYANVGLLLGTEPGNLYGMYDVSQANAGGPWWGGWEPGTGFIEPVRLDDGLIGMSIPSDCLDALTCPDGRVVSLWQDSSNTAHYEFWLLLTGSSETEAYELVETSLCNGYECRSTDGLYSCDKGLGVFLFLSNQTEAKSKAQHWRLESDNWITEDIGLQSEYDEAPWLVDTCQTVTDEPLCLYYRHNGSNDSDISRSYYIAEHLDPRL